MSKQQIEQISVTFWNRCCLNRQLKKRKCGRTLELTETEKSVSHQFDLLQQAGKCAIPQHVIDAIRHTGAHQGTAMVLKNAVSVPPEHRRVSRSELREGAADNDYERRAALATMAYLGAAGFRPLPEYFDNVPEYWTRVIGVEIGPVSYPGCKHRLPKEVSTLHPHKPFGPSLFGMERAHKLDAISPDLLAFIVMDKADDRKDIGPLIYSIDEVLSKLEPHIKELLMHEHYKFDPDVFVTKNDKLRFGSIRHINIIGIRGTDEEPDGRTYWRYLGGRVTDDEEHVMGPVKCLEAALLSLGDEKKCLDIDRGDILLVNNRRAATRWRGASPKKGMFRGAGETRLQYGDRTINRMSFYSPEEIELGS